MGTNVILILPKECGSERLVTCLEFIQLGRASRVRTHVCVIPSPPHTDLSGISTDMPKQHLVLEYSALEKALEAVSPKQPKRNRKERKKERNKTSENPTAMEVVLGKQGVLAEYRKWEFGDKRDGGLERQLGARGNSSWHILSRLGSGWLECSQPWRMEAEESVCHPLHAELPFSYLNLPAQVPHSLPPSRTCWQRGLQ